jgi:hypothetical protein
LLEAYPQLIEDDLRAALAFAARVHGTRPFSPLSDVFVADENVSRLVIERLRSRAHDAISLFANAHCCSSAERR